MANNLTKELLLKYILDKRVLLSEINVKLAKLEVAKDPIRKEIALATEELQSVCSHPQDRLKKTSEYFEGGYLNRANTVYTVTCSDCGKVLASYEESGGYA